MTRLVVHAGSCGFTVTVTARKGERGMIGVSIASDCEMIMNMSPDVALLDSRSVTSHYSQNPVFRAASKHVQHASCPVMSGIIKAVEVESGINTPRNVLIEFKHDDDSSDRNDE